MTQFKTFTNAEREALSLHGLTTSGPSQLSDAFVLGMRYARTTSNGVGVWQRGCDDGKAGTGVPPGGGDFSPYANGYRWGEKQRNAGVGGNDA